MTEKWVRDTGLVFSLFFLILGVKSNPYFLGVTAALLLMLMFFPDSLRPIAKAWFLVAELLGSVMNKVFFGLVFFLVITPLGAARRILKQDQRDLKRNNLLNSMLIQGRGLITKEDITRPY